MDRSPNRWAARYDPTKPITPMNNKYGCGWEPADCVFCDDPQLAWMFPVGDIFFLRRVTPGAPKQLIDHAAQQYYTCARCAVYAAHCDWPGLAAELGLDAVPKCWVDWGRARLKSPGFRWSHGRPYGWTPYQAWTQATDT